MAAPFARRDHIKNHSTSTVSNSVYALLPPRTLNITHTYTTHARYTPLTPSPSLNIKHPL